MRSAQVRNKGRILRGGARLLLGCFVLLGLWTLSLPLYVDLLSLGITLFVLVRAELSSVMVSTVSFACTLLVLALIAPIIAPSEGFYREHEKYARGGKYQPGVDDVISMPHGDLAAMDSGAPITLRVPRTVHFKTDSLGYRNQSDYHGQSIVIVGDSFVVGNGTDYPGTLPAILKSSYGLDTYSLGYPSDPADYYARASEFNASHSGAARFVFLFFEGNDFKISAQDSGSSAGREPPSARFARILDAYDKSRARVLGPYGAALGYPQYLFVLSRRLEREFLERESTGVSYYKIGGEWTAYLDAQTRNARAVELELLSDMDPSLASVTSCIVLIPTKARVYRKWLPSEVSKDLRDPPPAADALHRSFDKFKIPVIDLSPVLESEAGSRLAHGEFIYWRDDTHWNEHGMRAAAPRIADCISARPSTDPR